MPSKLSSVSKSSGNNLAETKYTQWKLILSDADEEYLFDQQEDPFELTNRIVDPALAPVRDKLRTELTAWMKSIGDRPYPVWR